MKIFVSRLLSSALKDVSKEEFTIFNNGVKELKQLNRTDILSSEKTVLLSDEQDSKLYAYNTQGAKYIVLTFPERNKMVLLDYIELFDGDTIVSLVFGNNDNNSKIN